MLLNLPMWKAASEWVKDCRIFGYKFLYEKIVPALENRFNVRRPRIFDWFERSRGSSFSCEILSLRENVGIRLGETDCCICWCVFGQCCDFVTHVVFSLSQRRDHLVHPERNTRRGKNLAEAQCNWVVRFAVVTRQQVYHCWSYWCQGANLIISTSVVHHLWCCLYTVCCCYRRR